MKKLRFGIKNRTNPKGETRVYIIYSFNRDQRTEIGTDIYIQPELWNKEKQEVNKKHPSAAQFNNHLLLQKVELEAIYLKLTAQGKTPFPEIIRDLHDKKGGQNIDETNFFDNLDQWIERRKNQVSLDSWKDYKSLKKHLLGFHSFRKKKIRFESIDYSFYEDFVNYLHYEVIKPNGEYGLAPNTVGKQIKNFKLFLRNCMRRNIAPRIDLDGFKVINIQTDSVYLSEDELALIEDLDLSKEPKLDGIRDLFLVGCETGLRHSDFVNLNNECIRENLIRLTTRKTFKKVVILISERLNRVIKKHNGHFPPGSNKNEFNKLIKIIVRNAGIKENVQLITMSGNKKTEDWIPKHKLVASHTCRRTYCTNAYLRGLPTVVIRSSSGHSSDKMLFKYIKISDIEAAENALKHLNYL
jgi:integrase